MNDQELTKLAADLRRDMVNFRGERGQRVTDAVRAIQQLLITRKAIVPFVRIANSCEALHKVNVRKFKDVDPRPLPPLEDTEIVSTSLGACRAARAAWEAKTHE